MRKLIDFLRSLLSQPTVSQIKAASFDVSVKRVLMHEGGFVDHPNDPGGATNYGITQAVARQHGYTGDMRNLPLDTAKAIYKADYWAKGHCDKMAQIVAYQHFDACVNHGVDQAAKFLQRALGVSADGVIGPQTLDALSKADPLKVASSIIAQRIRFYTNLGTWSIFGKGWVRRVAANAEYLADDQ